MQDEKRKKMRNISILARLVLGYLIPSILVAAGSAYTVYQLLVVEKNIQTIISDDKQLVDIATKLKDTLLSEAQYQKKSILLQNEDLYNNFIQAKNNFNSLIQESQQYDTIDKIHTLSEEISFRHHELFVLFENEIASIKNKIIPEKIDKDSMLDSILEMIMELKELSKENMDLKIYKLNETVKQSIRFTITITIVSFIIWLIISTYITRSITLPLTALRKKTEEIARNTFEFSHDISSPPEIADLANSFQFMCDQLKNLDTMKNDFFTMMSHELRTPLTCIKEGANLLMETPPSEMGERHQSLLPIINEECDRLIGLVNAILDLAKMEAGMQKYSFTLSEIGPLINKAVVEISPLAKAKRISITEHIAELPVIRLDEEKILQVLRNLIGNAVKFSPKDATVSIRASVVQGYVEVVVQDTGPGIASQYLYSIFDKFRQDPGTPRQYKSVGNGLGLAIAKQIILAHGGKVWVESKQEQGSAFFFSLPA